MEFKFFEIRDRATFIPGLAILMKSYDMHESYLLQRTGYDHDHPTILLINLSNQQARHSPCDWQPGIRTMPVAHQYIVKNFNTLESGDVIDVEYILGEAEAKKIKELTVEAGENTELGQYVDKHLARFSISVQHPPVTEECE